MALHASVPKTCAELTSTLESTRNIYAIVVDDDVYTDVSFIQLISFQHRTRLIIGGSLRKGAVDLHTIPLGIDTDDKIANHQIAVVSGTEDSDDDETDEVPTAPRGAASEDFDHLAGAGPDAEDEDIEPDVEDDESEDDGPETRTARFTRAGDHWRMSIAGLPVDAIVTEDTVRETLNAACEAELRVRASFDLTEMGRGHHIIESRLDVMPSNQVFTVSDSCAVASITEHDGSVCTQVTALDIDILDER